MTFLFVCNLTRFIITLGDIWPKYLVLLQLSLTAMRRMVSAGAADTLPPLTSVAAGLRTTITCLSRRSIRNDSSSSIGRPPASPFLAVGAEVGISGTVAVGVRAAPGG